MKNSDLYEIIKVETNYPDGDSTDKYYAKSRFNSWIGIPHPNRQDAIEDGELHARVLKVAFPNLKGD